MEQQREGVLAGDAEELGRRLVADEHEIDEAVAREVAKDGARGRPPSSIKVSQTEKVDTFIFAAPGILESHNGSQSWEMETILL